MSAQFTLQDFANLVAERLEAPKGRTYDAVKEAFEAMAAEVSKGGRAAVHAFGSFVLVPRKERKGRNPKTGETIKIPARKVVVFKAAKDLREAANKAKRGTKK
jgi:DNA-binding protein HU-beta